MGMNPDENRFEDLHEPPAEHLRATLGKMQKRVEDAAKSDMHRRLIRPDGSPVPDHWPIFTIGEEITIKDYRFKVAYIGERTLLLEPLGIPIIGESEGGS